MKPEDALYAENRKLREGRDDARRWAAAWKASARANHDAYQDAYLNYQETMRQFDAQQKRACEAEDEVLTLREIVRESSAELLSWCGIGRQLVEAYELDDLTVGDNMLEDIVNMAREILEDDAS